MLKDYFELLSLPKKLVIDHNELKKQYHKLVKTYSTDPVLDKLNEKMDDKEKLKLVETAYRTLKDRFERIVHLLEVEGITFKKDRAPTQFVELEQRVDTVLEKVKSGDEKKIEELKILHQDILNQFSTVSVELAHLEKAWDASNDNVDEVEEGAAQAQGLLKKLGRKSAAFNYIRLVEQNVRLAVNS
jgi:DnaJ-domain-containing protein 1